MFFRKKKKIESFAPRHKEIEIKYLNSVGDKEMLLHHIEEIKSMRDEIEWRVRNAYNASIVFLSAITITGGALFSTENRFFDKIKDPDVMSETGIVVLIAISAWVGVQNANHLVEKRIELYTLELMKIIYANSGHAYFSWLGFLYGSTFFRSEFRNWISRILNASIGVFIYFLPNAVALLIFIYLLRFAHIDKYLFFFILASIFLLVAASSTVFFFFYMFKVNAKFTEFYKKVMEPYFERKYSHLFVP